MILGTFNGELYNFDGKWWKPKWLAHSGRITLDKMKPILEAGHAYGVSKASYPRGILVAAEKTWNTKIAGTPYAGTWGGLCQLHYCFYGQPIGNAPTWAASFKGYNNLLIHEYEDGKVAYLRSSDVNELYAFFDYVNPSDAPVEHTSEDIPPVVIPPQNQPIPAGNMTIEVDFKIGNLPIVGKVTIKG